MLTWQPEREFAGMTYPQSENRAHNVTVDTMVALARAIDADVHTVLKHPPKGR
jgi:hypothetical protein